MRFMKSWTSNNWNWNWNFFCYFESSTTKKVNLHYEGVLWLSIQLFQNVCTRWTGCYVICVHLLLDARILVHVYRKKLLRNLQVVELIQNHQKCPCIVTHNPQKIDPSLISLNGEWDPCGPIFYCHCGDISWCLCCHFE